MRKKTLWLLGISFLFLILVTVLGIVWEDAAQQVDFARKNLPPGTDGLFALLASLGGGLMDSLVCGLINLVMGIPHMLLLILISYSLGKGFRGVAAGIALTHWASLTRLLRAEILQIRESPYVRISEKLGKKPWWIAWNHIVPQVSRQFVTGLILLFPHAILHEAGVTFLGFGLSSEQPAIGVILSESMSYLITGKWWLALFPGAALVLVTLGFQAIGQSLGRLMDPGSAHE